MRHEPFVGTILLLKYKEIFLFNDLGIFETDGPTVCRMDVADLEEVMAEVAFWVYNDIGNIYCTWPSLGHTWGVDKCADLWQVCYQYCTDMYMYEFSTYLEPTERFKQLYADWKKDFNVKPGDTFDEPYPGGDEWVLSYLQSHSSGIDEDLYVPIIPMQERSLFCKDGPHKFRPPRLFGLHGPHSMAQVGFGAEVDFTPFEVDASALTYNGVYRVMSSSDNTGRWDQSGLKRYVVKDSEGITTFTTSQFRLENRFGDNLADDVALQPPPATKSHYQQGQLQNMSTVSGAGGGRYESEERKRFISNEVGHSAALDVGDAGSSIQRRLRKMSVYPREPRVFSEAKILVPLGWICIFLVMLLLVVRVEGYLKGERPIGDVVGASVVTLLPLTILSYGLWRRFGVDEDKVWTRFGCLFYREVRFDEITRFKIGFDRYKLYAGRTLVNIDYNRFDYSLVYIRLMEELARHRFDLPEAKVDDPNWEEQCQRWKNVFMSDVYEAHVSYYEQHPEELVKLQQLAQTSPAPKQ